MMLEPVPSTPPIIIGPTNQPLHNNESASPVDPDCTTSTADDNNDGPSTEGVSPSRIISSSSFDSADCASRSQHTSSTAAATLHTCASSDIFSTSTADIMTYPTVDDGDEGYDEEIVNIMRYDPDDDNRKDASCYGTVNAAVVSPFERWTTPRIANRKVLPREEASFDTANQSNHNNTNNNTANDSLDFGSDVPSSIAPSSSAAGPPDVFADFSFAVADLSMSQFEKADSEFFAEFNHGNSHSNSRDDGGGDGGSGDTKKEQSAASANMVVPSQHQKTDGITAQDNVKIVSEENSLDYDECRPLDITDINDIVNASRTQSTGITSTSSSSSNNKNDNDMDDARYLKDYEYHDEVSTQAQQPQQHLNSSPHSVMDLDPHGNNASSMFTTLHPPKQQPRGTGEKKNRNNASYFSESSSSTNESRDASGSFLSGKKIRGRKGTGVHADDASSKQSSVVEDIVYSAPMTKLYEFITGDAMCCVSKDRPDICSEYEREEDRRGGSSRRNSGKKSKKKSKKSYGKKKYEYEDKESEDDYTYDMSYDSKTYDEGTYDDGTYDMSHDDGTHRQHRRGGSAVSMESSAFYTEDDYDDETVSRASTRSSSHHHVTKSKSHKSKPALQQPPAITPTIDDGSPPASAQPRKGSRRGRSPTIRDGYNSDRSLSRGLSRAGSFGSDEKRGGHGIDPMKGDDSEVSAAESVLSQDQDNWMEMTVTPSRKPSLGNSNFVQHLRSKTASATPSPTKADRIVSKNPPPPVYVEEMSPETNGYFKKLLSVGIQLLINDPPSTGNSNCQMRQGKLLLCFNGSTEGNFEAPFFIWKDMDSTTAAFTAPDETNKIDSILLSDIKTIRKPRKAELDGYPVGTPEHCFVLSLFSGVTFFLEAVNSVQMNRVTAGLNGILNKLELDINNTGDFTWIMQSLEAVKKKPCDVQPSVARTSSNSPTPTKKSLVQQAAERRKLLRRRQR